jgi:predicted RND superfamily exporter protein
MGKFKEKFINLLVEKPWYFILTSFLVLALTVPFLTKLKMDFGIDAWFKKDHPVSKELRAFEKEFANDESVIIAITSDHGVINARGLKSIGELTDEFLTVNDIYSVDSLTNYSWIHSNEDDLLIEDLFDPEVMWDAAYLRSRRTLIKKDEVLQNYLISPTLNATLIVGKLRPFFSKTPNYVSIKESLSTLLDKHRTLYPELEYHLLGKVAVNAALKQVAFKDTSTLLPLLFALIIAFLIIFFRNAPSVILPFLVTLFSIVATMGFGGLIGMKMVNISFTIPVILVAISIADAVHIVDIFLKKLVDTPKKEALLYSVNKNFSPTVLTSITTAIGFLSLLTSELQPIKYYGLVSGFGVLLAWFFSFFFLVPSLMLFKVKPKVQKVRTSKLSLRYFNFLVKNKLVILVSFLTLTGVLIYNASHIYIDANPYMNFKEDNPLRRSNAIMLKNFGGLTGPEIVIDSGKKDGVKDPAFLRKVDKFIDYIQQDPKVNNVSSIVSTLKRMNKSFNGDREEFYTLPNTQESIAQLILLFNISVPSEKSLYNFISRDHQKLRLSLFWTLQSSNEGLAKADEILKKAKEMGFNASVTGKVNAKQRMVNFVISTFIKSIAISFCFVLLILMIHFKSVWLGLLGMLPNVTPLAFASGIMVILDVPVNFTVAVVSSICLGIAVDDTIHFVVNYIKSRRRGETISNSLLDIFENTAGSLILTTVILMAGFGVFGFSDFLPNRNFGLLASGVLFVALVTDLVLLPILLLYSESFKLKRAGSIK